MLKILSIAYRILAISIGVSLIALSIRYMTVDNIALFYLIQSIVAIQMIIEMGISNTAIQFIQTEMVLLRKSKIIRD